MPKSAPKPCTKVGCGVLVRDGSGRCGKHPKPIWTKRVETKRIGGRKRQALRTALWVANPYCAHCRQLLDMNGKWERDHIIPLGEGGTEDETNTQVLCIPCHDVKSKSESLRGQRRARG